MSKNKIKYLVYLITSVALIQLGTLVYAADGVKIMDENLETTDIEKDIIDEVDENIEVVIVTASRRTEALQDVPASVIAVDPIEFVNLGLNSIDEVIDYTPGFNIFRDNGHRGLGSITARGVGQQGSTAVTAIYLDDVPMTSNSGFANGGGLFFDGLLGDVERIELIKGPQGTLFGATAIAGAVRYISRKPELVDARGSITADLSAINDGGINKLYRGFYSFPLIEDKLGITLSGFSASDAGFVDQVDAETGEIIRKNANDSDNRGFSADLFYNATDNLSFRFKGLQQKTTFGLGSAVRFKDLNKKELYGKLKSDDAFGDLAIENKMVSASMAYEFNSSTLDITTSKVKYESISNSDFSSIFADFIDSIDGLPQGSTTSTPFVGFLDSDKTSTEIRLTSESNDKFEWVVGLYAANESTNNRQTLIGEPSGFVGLRAEFPSKYRERAVFGNFTYYFSPNFDVTAGMRYADTELALSLFAEGVFVAPADDTLETAKDKVQTYLFTARYRPSDDTSFYARIASGYRPASSSIPLQNPNTGAQITPSVVAEDTLWSYEVGVKGELVNGFFSYETGIWYVDWDNFQATVFAFGASSLNNAKNGITAYGFEGAFTLRPDNGFSLTTSLAYTNSTLNGNEPELFGLKGADVPSIPRWTISSIGRYDFQMSNNTDTWIGAGFRYTGTSPSAFTDDNELNETFNVDSDAILLFDLNAGIQWINIVLNLYINNLFNNDSYRNFSAFQVPGTTDVDFTGVPVTPRTIGASLTYLF